MWWTRLAWPVSGNDDVAAPRIRLRSGGPRRHVLTRPCRRCPDPSADPLRPGQFLRGGRDVSSDTLSTLPAYAASGTVTVDQIYVRFQVPVSPTRAPLVLIHGCCLTGKTWETTPDGRMGWDEYFVRKGFPTYVIDQSWRGARPATRARSTP